MEAAMAGGGSLSNVIDSDWDSICGILSMDQESDFSNLLGHHPSSDQNQGLLISLLMEDGNDSIITSPFAQYYTQQPLPNQNTSPQLMSCSSLDDLSNHSTCNVECYHDSDDYHQMVKGSNTHQPTTKRTRNHLRTQPNQILPPKKKARVSKNVGKGKRKTQSMKRIFGEAKVEESEEDRKSSCEESIVSEESSIRELNDKKRAIRGAATDPQSLYARRRRERINERLRILQTLVPNGTKVDISTMLEEAVNYVKFLQLQIKLLSSDEMWMYAPLAYNGFDVGHYNRFW